MDNQSNRWEERDTNGLYHYTNACAAVNILQSGLFRLSNFKKSNDPKEVYPALQRNCKFSDDEHKRFCEQFFDYYENNIRYMSCMVDSSNDLCNDSKKKQYFCGKGFNHPRMWAQYAENHTGVCICFNKKKIEKRLRTQYKGKIYSERIEYEPYIKSTKDVELTVNGGKEIHTEFIYMINKKDIKGGALNTEKKIKKNYKEYFFKKLDDWRDEMEHRFICLCNKGSTSEIGIENIIEYIILGQECCDNCKKEIMTYCKKLNIPCKYITYLNGNAQLRELD